MRRAKRTVIDYKEIGGTEAQDGQFSEGWRRKKESNSQLEKKIQNSTRLRRVQLKTYLRGKEIAKLFFFPF